MLVILLVACFGQAVDLAYQQSTPCDTGGQKPCLSEAESLANPVELYLDEMCERSNSDGLHIVTWNIEWFPKNGRLTVDYVAEVIRQLDVDVLAIQEVDDRRMFARLLEELPAYTGYDESLWFAGLAYIYKTDAIVINDLFEIYTTSPYWNAFPRSPMVMDMSFQGERYFLINNHLKCCGDGFLELEQADDEETRRYDAMLYLKDYVDEQLGSHKVIILGDLNDDITEASPHNVFQSFLDEPEHYQFADISIAEGRQDDWSYPSWPSHLDHILVSKQLFTQLAQSQVYTIKVDEAMEGGFDAYEASISDHRPVGMCLHVP